MALYYEAAWELEAAMRGKRTGWPLFKQEMDARDMTREQFVELEKRIFDRRETLCSIFMDAVDRHDGATIINLAHAAWFFKDKTPSKGAPDRRRIVLLFLKSLMDKDQSLKFDMDTICRFILLCQGSPGKPDANFIRSTRNMCEELQIAVKESRKGRKKKP